MNEIGASLGSMLAKRLGVAVTTKFNATNFTVVQKVFAFTKGDAVAMTLLHAVIGRLLDGNTKRFVMG